MQIVMYTRQNCLLCDEGEVAVKAVFGSDNVTLVDVDLDLDLLEKYTNRVPVVETRDGVVVCEGDVTESALRGFNSRR